MPFYVGRGSSCKEFRFDETVVRLWKATVNGEAMFLRGTEQAVMEYVSDNYYWEDWHVMPYKFLVLASQVKDVN